MPILDVSYEDDARAVQRLPGLDHVTSTAFQKDAEQNYRRWDKEWMRYLNSDRDYAFYFTDFDTPNYALSVSPQTIANFAPEETHSTKLYKRTSASVWIDGQHLVNRRVLEMGCGPGMLGRLASRFASYYVGIDVSMFALSIAKLTSPADRCTYVHLSETDQLRRLAKSADTCVGRNFFIHHNYADSLWILNFLRDMTKPGGLISADFQHVPDRVGEPQRHKARDQLNEKHPSALYHFEREDIESIADAAGLELISSACRPDLNCYFAVMRVSN